MYNKKPVTINGLDLYVNFLISRDKYLRLFMQKILNYL